ncbi:MULTISPECIES: hypothetical protein [unclassified Fibrobacter]|uniref:hypothetical protein n=1 Tax=unclassified Fibrobacter TaxID=2634177 RepID=UPI0025C14AE2|nr:MULTISPECIES: hypothetical protein [unclassified Fibrobacter]
MFDMRAQLASKFLSLNFFLLANEKNDDFTVPVSQIKKWMGDFYDWAQEMFKDRPYYAYGRSVTFAVEDGVFNKEKLKAVMESVSEMGFSVSLKISLRSLRENLDFMTELSKQKCLGSLMVTIANKEVNVLGGVEAIFARIKKMKVAVTLLGSMKDFFIAGVFSSPSLNGSDVSFFLQEPEACDKLNTLSKEMTPCQEKMVLCVNSEGLVFPCAGLMSSPRHSLGSVFDKDFFSTFRMEGDILEWAFVGPDLLPEGPVLSESGMPWPCRRHVAEVLTNG